MKTMKFLLFFVITVLPIATLAAQNKMKSETLPQLGQPKTIDGSMDEWSPLGGVGGHGTVDNEYYIYDTSDNFWNDPQGGINDEPLSILALEKNPITGNEEPVASGFNLWGVYICYEHFHNDHCVVLGLDLPLSSNNNVSPDWQHTYNNLPPLYKFFYPVAFDADGNGDPMTCNNLEYYPGGENGFNFVRPGIYDDCGLPELYYIDLYIGDDNFPSNKSTSFLATDGLHIQIILQSLYGVILEPEVLIPGKQTISGTNLDLVDAYGPDIIDVGGHINPDPFSSPRIVDIEIRINRLRTIIEDPTYIDWNKVPIGQFTVRDLRKIYMRVLSGTMADLSREHIVQGGHVFPEHMFTIQASKKY